MLYLFLAILSSAAIAVFMRLSNRKISGNTAMLVVNYIVCFVLSAVLAGADNLLPKTEALGLTMGLGTINGFLYLSSFLAFQYSIRKNGVVLSSIFMKLSLLVPIIVAVVFFKEVPQVLQIVGFVLALVAIFILNYQKNQQTTQAAGCLFLLLLLGGCGDAMSKVFEELGNATLSDHFLLFTFGTALVLCILLMILKKERIGKWEWFFGLLVGVPNFFSAKFLLKSLAYVPATVAYPTFSAGTLLTVTLIGILLFKERLKKAQWFGVVLIMGALVLLNL